MNIERLEVRNFRNIEHCEITPCRETNIIYGQNAQGKTNLLESIWLFTGCRSFRGSRDKDMISFGASKAILDMDFYAFDREQNAHLEIGDSRKFHLGGIKKTPGQLMGSFLCVVFSPVHLSLVKDGPYERRRFLDIAVSQLKPKYAVTLSQYNKALMQRNFLLKDIKVCPELYDTLDAWEDRIAFFASEIIRQRYGYVRKLSEYADEIYAGLSSGKEKLEIAYSRREPSEAQNKQEIYEELRQQLLAARQNDILTGSTSVGPHRDDLLIKIDGLAARAYGSQGQQRSAALALKLGEAAVVRSFSTQQPVALLDDVMSELDETRQNYILNHIRQWQVFITCCDPSAVKNLKNGKKFHMDAGRII